MPRRGSSTTTGLSSHLIVTVNWPPSGDLKPLNLPALHGSFVCRSMASQLWGYLSHPSFKQSWFSGNGSCLTGFLSNTIIWERDKYRIYLSIESWLQHYHPKDLHHPAGNLHEVAKYNRMTSLLSPGVWFQFGGGFSQGWHGMKKLASIMQ